MWLIEYYITVGPNPEECESNLTLFWGPKVP